MQTIVCIVKAPTDPIPAKKTFYDLLTLSVAAPPAGSTRVSTPLAPDQTPELFSGSRLHSGQVSPCA